MKNPIKFMLVGIAYITACQGRLKDADLIGVYVHQSSGEYAVADDTLRISRTDGNHYLLIRTTGYRAIREGKLLPKKLKTERLEGDFDAAGLVLKETLAGRVYRFDPDQNVLLLK